MLCVTSYFSRSFEFSAAVFGESCLLGAVVCIIDFKETQGKKEILL